MQRRRRRKQQAEDRLARSMCKLGPRGDQLLRCVLALLLSVAAPGDGLTAQSEDTRAITPQDILNVNEIGGAWGPSQVQISPDGKWVVYQMRRTLLGQNRYVFDLWLTDAAGSGSPRQLTNNEPTRRANGFITPRWAPDSKALAYFSSKGSGNQIWLIRLSDLEEVQVTGSEEMRAGFEERVRGVVSDFKWSPDGSLIAFTQAVRRHDATGIEPLHGLEVLDPRWAPGSRGAPAAALCVVQVATRSTSCLTDGSKSVHSFDWSPDGRQLVVSASEGRVEDGYMRTDLFLIDVNGGDLRPLVAQDGRDSDPVWSPDGRWIAFLSQAGVLDWMQDAMLAVVSADGGVPTYPATDFREQVSGTPGNIAWAPDSRSIYFQAPWQMTQQLFVVSREGGIAARVSPRDDRYYGHFGYAMTEGLAAFTMQSVTDPPEVYVAALDRFEPLKITGSNPQLNDVARATVERVQWPSTDGEWTIHGALIKPPDFQPGHRYPVIMFIQGGPGMVNMTYDLSRNYPLQVFAAKGYMVLAPNTRGRRGYGYAFDRAIRDNKDYGPGPYQDATAGVDWLIANGLADPERVGIVGFSYGAYLAAYAITRTRRFRAASIGDGATDMPYALRQSMGDPSMVQLYKDLLGFDPPYDRDGLAEAIRQSPIHHVQNVRTPTLLEYGEESLASTHGQSFYHGLLHFNVPVEFVVYPRTGHGINEPRLREDSMVRNLEWMDYWVMGKSIHRLVEKWGLPRSADDAERQPSAF